MNAGTPQSPPRVPEAAARAPEAPGALLRIDVDAGPVLYVWDVHADGSFTVTPDVAKAMRFEVPDAALLARVQAEAQRWPLSPVASFGVGGP